MRVIIKPSTINGTITAPASKSAMQRACALALLHAGETIIGNPGFSEDEQAAVGIIKKLGAKVTSSGLTSSGLTSSGLQAGEKEPEKMIIHSPGLHSASMHDLLLREINCGESGLSLRMFTPIIALYSGRTIITGKGSLMHRPVDLFEQIFPQLGVSIKSSEGKLPIDIEGPLVPADITVDGSLSSQFLTGLLMAFAHAAKQQVRITVTDLKSRPSIDLTLQMMKHFGYRVENENYMKFIIHPPSTASSLQRIHYTVEGDWSSAAFILVAGAIAGETRVHGLDTSSAQGDKRILEALKMASAGLSISPDEIVSAENSLKAFHFNATDCPDLFPPLMALAVNCSGTSVIEGVHRLAHKESNRAHTLKQEFEKMGAEVLVEDDLMRITGTKLVGTNVDSHHDHRVAMACAVAALRASGETVIGHADAINKSYPDFYRHLKMLGANVSLPLNQQQ